jgi:1-acyl-sn-glycerol-3-phosphate acyltransferase
VKAVLRAGFGVWCWTILVLVVGVVLLLALPAPTVTLRRRIARSGARAFFVLTGIHYRVIGAGRLPKGASIVVANHSSYVDGLVLQAALPPRFAFVIKKEMVRVPFMSLLLRRLGSQFVERYDRQQGAGDARRLLRTAAAGQALAFFPEGTFSVRVGLAHFHAGAFVAAARAAILARIHEPDLEA